MSLNVQRKNDRLYVLSQLKDLVTVQKRIISPILQTDSNPDVSRNGLEYKDMDSLETQLLNFEDKIDSMIDNEHRI